MVKYMFGGFTIFCGCESSVSGSVFMCWIWPVGGSVSFLVLHNTLPHSYQPETTQICDVTVAADQESRHGLGVSSGSQKGRPWCWLGRVLVWSLRSSSELTWLLQSSLPWSCSPEVLISSRLSARRYSQQLEATGIPCRMDPPSSQWAAENLCRWTLSFWIHFHQGQPGPF